MRAKVKERKSGSFPAEIAASLLKLLFRLQFFQIKQNCSAFINLFEYLKFDEFFPGPDSRERAHPLSVEAALELQDGSGVLLGAAAPPLMAAP